MTAPVTAQGAAARLGQGAELLSKRLKQDDRYLFAAAELQKHWKVKVRRVAHTRSTLYGRGS